MAKRGRLRVFLGAAPGVGKTYAMLEEGHRLRAEGRDVAIGYVEPHGREDTAALVTGLEVIPRVLLRHRGGSFEEMDLDAVLERGPDVALIDELAHTNVPGSRHDKRWQDVEVVLDAGIDVLTTLNIQHLESLNDVVYEITGVTQRETIPDEMVRRAEQIELVDLTQQGITERMAAGKIYPAERIDAALGNYFRPGNLDALRELALSWTADRVDETLATYRETHGIADLWETKERVVVAFAGALGGDIVIRRAARLAMRGRAELAGVFVRPTDGLADGDHPALGEQKALLERLGGRYYEIVGDDVGAALLGFARAENATQLVLGASRRTRIEEWLRGSPIGRVIRDAGPLDVHVISYEGARRRRSRRRSHVEASISSRRRWAAWVLAVVGLPLLTWVLRTGDMDLALHNILLVYLMAALLVAAVGGVWPAVATAGAGFLLANWFFTEPVRTWTIADPDNLFSLFSFLVVAVVVGLLVGTSTRRRAEARKARAQAEALAATAFRVDPHRGAAGALVHRVRETFSLSATALLRRTGDGWERLAASGDDIAAPERGTETISVTDDTVLVIRNGRLTADDRRVLRAFAAQITQAVEREALEEDARNAEAMVEADRLRTALLGAVSHDLRTPLATIKASVTSLLETGVAWTSEDTLAFLTTIRDETERLNRLVGLLLDASRVQAGAVQVFLRDVSLEEIVSTAIAGLGPLADNVKMDVPETLPHVQTDPALLERVVANLVENAARWSPPGAAVTVSAGQVRGRIDLRISDRGPGIPGDRRDQVFQPFQRLDDNQQGEGVGLGLAVARGFLDAMGADLLVEDTPGGGATMVIGLDRTRRNRSHDAGRPEVPS